MTFFTYAKGSTWCGKQDLRISLSKRFTFFNFLVSALQSHLVLVLIGDYKSEFLNENTLLDEILSDFTLIILSFTIYQFFASFFTLLFIFYDYLCCHCCDCYLGPTKWTAFDPEDREANLERWSDGKMHDMEIEEEENIVREQEIKLSGILCFGSI